MKNALLLFIIFIPLSLSSDDSNNKYLDIKYAKEKRYEILNHKEEDRQKEIDLARRLLNDGLVLNKQKKYNEAVKKYQESLKYNTPPETYYEYGNTLDNIGAYENAIKAWTISIELDYAKVHLSYYNIGCAYSKLKDKDRAYEYIKMSLSHGYKTIDYIKTDPDLQFLRASGDWDNQFKELLKIFNEKNFDITNKKIYYEQPGVGDKHFYFFYPGNRAEFHYIYMQIGNKENYIKIGKWKIDKDNVTINWKNQRGQKGVGEPLPGCGSVCSYATYEPYTKALDQVEILSLIEIKASVKKNEPGSWRIENMK